MKSITYSEVHPKEYLRAKLLSTLKVNINILYF